jgi:hypothetical protein
MKYLNLITKYVISGSEKNGTKRDLKHFERTLYWLLQLKPDANEALQIAAFSHDVERVFRTSEYTGINNSSKGFRDGKHLDHHQTAGAKIAFDFLSSKGADNTLKENVYSLISKHEVGGNDDQNLLKDADSLSFFENNIDFFLSKQVENMGKDKVKDKFDWMYKRITSVKAKNIAKKWYQDAIRKLGR